MTDNHMDIEGELKRLGVPDDIAEVTQTFTYGPDQASIERIKQRTMQMAQSDPIINEQKRNHLKLWIAPAVAVAAIFLVIILSIGPNNVMAAVNSLLLYIPGFGIHSTENVNLVAPNPVRAEREGVKIDINGLLADGKGTSLIAYVEGKIPDINSSYLVDLSGKRYPYQGGGIGESAGTGTRIIQVLGSWYKALPANVRQVALVIPSLSNWTINIPLAPASSLNASEKFGPSIKTNNVIVSGQATSFADETKVTLLVQSLRGGIFQNVNEPVLTGSDGEIYPLNSQPGFLGSGLSYFSTNPHVGTRITVMIPSLLLQQDVQGNAVIPVPEKDSPLALNQSLKLGSWNLKLRKAEVVVQDGTWLRVYVEPDSIDGATVNGLEKLRVNGKEDSWCSEFDKSTGSMKWFQVPYPQGNKNVSITVNQVHVQVDGPWKIDLPVAPGFD